jgi:hypothetical protein
MTHEDYIDCIYRMVEGRTDLGSASDKEFHFRREIRKYNEKHNPQIPNDVLSAFLEKHKFT